MDYTVLPIIRTKRLNDGYFEVILKKKREILYRPGDSLYIKKDPSADWTSVFVASGVSEPWLRIILPEEDYEKISQASKIRAKNDISREALTLHLDLDKPIFICEGLGIAPFLSYISSYPSEWVIVYTIGNVPNQAWIDCYPQAIKCSSVKHFKDIYAKQALKNHYIFASDETRQAIEKHLASVKIKNITSVKTS